MGKIKWCSRKTLNPKQTISQNKSKPVSFSFFVLGRKRASIKAQYLPQPPVQVSHREREREQDRGVKLLLFVFDQRRFFCSVS